MVEFFQSQDGVSGRFSLKNITLDDFLGGVGIPRYLSGCDALAGDPETGRANLMERWWTASN